MAAECNKRRKTYYFHENWELDFCFISVKDQCVCLFCGVSLAVGRKCNVQRHFTTIHSTFSKDFPVGSNLWKEKIKELKTQRQRQQSLFTRPVQKATACTEASFKVAHILKKRKKAFTDGGVVKEAMTAVAEML